MSADGGSEREREAAVEGVFREVNEQIESIQDAFGGMSDDIAIVCECADPECVEQVFVPQAEYDRVRAEPSQFFVVPGHAAAAIEAVVEKHDGWCVVRKNPGEPERIAKATAR